MTSQAITPEAVVQRQLDAYNAHDIDALISIYTDDAQQFEHPATLLARGSTQIRERFVVRFQEPNVHAQLVNRMVQGNIVIDQEMVTRTFPEGTGRIEMVAIYEVRDDRIANAWFILGKKTLDDQSAKRKLGEAITMHATGTFEVKLNPMTPEDEAGGAAIGRLSINKQFFGDLAATSIGQMVAIGTATAGSAGYVAMEVVTGKLQGRSGSFALQHSGTANRGATTLTVSVVPDSGTDELLGLAGQLQIIIADGKHMYEFDYTF